MWSRAGHKLPVRVRPAAHLIAENATYLRQLDLAFQRFRALPDSDPRSVFQQMNFHCFYGYPGVIHQAGEPGRVYRTHGNWLFFPFHRWYTFFFERTLAKLVGDDSLVLPFWNWDNQSPDYQHLPNTVPFYFRDPDKYPGLYHKYRDPRHRPGAEPAVVNLNLWSVVAGYAPVTPQEVAQARADNNAIMRFLLDSTANGERAPFLSDPLRHGRGKMDNDGFFREEGAHGGAFLSGRRGVRVCGHGSNLPRRQGPALLPAPRQCGQALGCLASAGGQEKLRG